MASPISYISDQLSDIKKQELSYRKLHSNAFIRDARTDSVIKIPFMSLTNKYKDFLEPYKILIPLSNIEQYTYKYQPKKLSEEMYGTTELWYTLLELNNLKSITEFTPTELYMYDPHKIVDLINEILILEGLL